MSNVPGGPPCPTCNARTSVVKDSRCPETSTYTYRRRLCTCGVRFSTVEISSGEYERLARLGSRLKTIQEALDEPT